MQADTPKFFRVSVCDLTSRRETWTALVEASDRVIAAAAKAAEAEEACARVRAAGGEPEVGIRQITSVWDGMDPNGFIRPI